MRCPWANGTPNMQAYHDTIWGVPEHDDQQLFRKLVLDMNQAGLSWQTILNKIQTFDEAYEGFAIHRVAQFDAEKIEELMQNPGVIRNRRKIEAAITNAQQVQLIQQEFGSFSDYLWQFTNFQVVNGAYQTQEEVPTTSNLSDALAKDLKKRGFKFVGSTTIYAFLEAVGVINDHLTSCFRHQEVRGMNHA
ncbi:MAG: DNA-3-methyladenine glycosylase I [Enterococcus sp.]